jgi:hypothetical protein
LQQKRLLTVGRTGDPAPRDHKRVICLLLLATLLASADSIPVL